MAIMQETDPHQVWLVPYPINYYTFGLFLTNFSLICQDDERRSERSHRAVEADNFEEEEDEESDADDFIVDDDGRPIAEKKKKRRHLFADASLQEGQDIFGVDFDYDEFEKYDDDDYEEESDDGEDQYEEDGEGELGTERTTKKPKKSARKKPAKKSIFEIYEPSELQRGHFTDLDNEIRKADIPERMQLRDVPITPVAEGSNELEEEAEWIYKQAFIKQSITNQEPQDGTQRERRKPPSTIGRIKQALDFIRNQQLEVPFIAFYRKEYVQPELNINDLWKVYKYDSKWCQLLTRKKSLLVLFEKMRNYIVDRVMKDPDAPLPEDLRLLKDDDIERIKSVQTQEELKDVHMHFLLYYAHEIPGMQENWRKQENERKKEERKAERRKRLLEAVDENGDPIEDVNLDEEPEEEDEPQPEETLKHAYDSGPYAMCRKAGVCGLAKKFGLTPEHFAENLRDNYQRHDVEQEESDPTETAKAYVSPKFTTPNEVLEAAKFVVARQLAREPLLRKCVREILYERAKITVGPTKNGFKEIDENHPCYGEIIFEFYLI